MSENLNASIYPLDFESLKKGDTITSAQIEEITGVGRNCGDEYDFQVLRLRFRIMQERRRMGMPVYVRVKSGELVILTDAEASVEQARRAEQAIDRLADANQCLQEVDVNNLREDEQRQHERRQLVAGSMLVGAIGARKDAIKAIPYKRSTPGLPAPNESTPGASNSGGTDTNND
jgi:hypothetical protein